MPPPDQARPHIAVTGAAGFVGSHLIDALHNAGLPVRVLYHRNKPAARTGIEAVIGDLNDSASLQVFLQDIEVVIHAGGLVAARDVRDFQRTNVVGTRNLAAAATRQGVRRFLLISSLAARLPDISPYAASKYAAEQILREFDSFAWDVIRPPAIYGPGDLQILPLFKLLAQGVALLPGGRNARVSVLHVKDLAMAIVAWVNSGAAHRVIYEIDDGARDGHAWREILAAAAQHLRVNPHYIVPPYRCCNWPVLFNELLRNLAAPRRFLSPGKIRELRHPDWVCSLTPSFTAQTGWNPETPLDVGLLGALQWYRQRHLLK